PSFPCRFPTIRNSGGFSVSPVIEPMSMRPRTTPQGFTLLELLVTVALIGALGAIVFVGVRSARGRAAMAVSSGNLRQLALANLSYAGEHGTFVPSTDPTNRVRWHGSRTTAGGQFDAVTGSLAPYLGRSRSVAQCPGFAAEV